ncbi:CHAT domain-containing protein [Cellulomonas sp. Leaf395]|uniref:CHAT domain-containing protein n=1 Tax=Cellulomonas sp. Leaf395 TaxID=1736362 RepID=UPI0006F4236A|nr:CHAT domain-containing protein [Cellulomonas sp. Leaf395]KQS99509.1 hypothetical protein ASG23_09035 [Cellulomonas sp. Leaf395]
MADPEALAWSLRALAWARRSAWDHATAERLLGEALRVSRRHGLGMLEAHLLMTRQAVRQEMGRVTSARRDLDAALVAVEGASDGTGGDRRGVLLHIRAQRATFDHNAGLLDRAESQYRGLVDLPGLTDTDRYKLLNNLALIVAERGGHTEAIRRSDQAVAVAGKLGPAAAAPAIQSRAWIAVQSGQLARGLRDFEAAAQIYADAGLPLGEYYAEYADTMADLRLLPEARAAAVRAVDEFGAANVPFMGAEAQLRLAQICLLEGDLDTARETADEAATVLERQRRTGWRDRARLIGVEAQLSAGPVGAAELDVVRRAAARLERAGSRTGAVHAHLVAGRVAAESGRDSVAVREFARASSLAPSGPVLVRIRGRVAEALGARIRGDSRATMSACRSGLRDLAVHRSSLPTMELRALASGHGAELGEIGLGVALQGGSPARVLAWMERTRAAALLTRLPVLDDDLGRLRPRDEPGGTAPAGEPRAPTRAGSLATGGTAPLDRSSAWMVAVTVRRPGARSVPTLGRIREALAGRVLVEYGRLDGRLVAVVVEPHGARVVELAHELDVSAELRSLFFALRRLANPHSPATAAAARASADIRVARLRRMVVEPLALNPTDELVVVPVGRLHGIPWSALHDGPLALAPSATFWMRTLETGPTGGGRTVLVAGPGLAGAQEEVDALRAVHPDAQVVASQQSFAAPVAALLADADLGHLACHGSLRADNPMFSSLELADGPVTVQELHTAGVAPRRLVLASCHAGADVAYAGGEVLGFVSAMLAQGTAGVVASVAAIPDVEAVDLMVALHRGLAAGDTMARALHTARGLIDRETPGGYVNWCTFSAHGAA